MAKYFVSYMVIYKDTVEADNPVEAVDIVTEKCPYNIVGETAVTNQDTGETFDFYVKKIINNSTEVSEND